MARPISSHLYVALQFTGMLLCVLPLPGTPAGSSWWLAISALGVLLAIYVLWHNRPGNFDIYPEPKVGCQLITSGPYRWLRHPMYSSLLLLMIGLALYQGTWSNLLGIPMVFTAVALKMRREEQGLAERFTDYPAYAARTKRLLPWLF